MATLLIFEGPDRVGKTSIAAEVARIYKAPYYHFGAPDKALQQTRGCHYQYKELVDQWAKEDLVVLDRSWISGLFYDYHRRFKVTPDYHEDYLILAQALEYYYIDVKVFFVYRDWTKNLIQEHTKEIQDDPEAIPATLCERAIEHYSWPGFIENYPYHAVNGVLTLKSDYESIINTALGTKTVARFGDYEVVRDPHRQAIVDNYADIWTELNWLNHDMPRTSHVSRCVPDCCQ